MVDLLAPGDPWFTRRCDAYLEPWGKTSARRARWPSASEPSRAIAYVRVRAAMPPEQRPDFDTDFSVVLRRAIARIPG